MEKGIDKLKDLISWFFNDSNISRIRVEFKNPLSVPKGEFYSDIVVGCYSSVGWASNNDDYVDVFMYGKQTKILAEYTVDKVDNSMKIRRIELWRDA